MKQCLYLLAAACLCISLSAKASPGDTTWVQTNVDTLGGYGSYDNAVTFPAPGTTYRKIYMIFTLGKYVCPGSPTYCGDWDYTVQNYLMTPTGDTLELGRLITPYANAGAPRTPWTWLQHYVFDVTDYVAMLQNSATMRIFYSGYSGGFTGNIKFAFIEGIPERNVAGITRLWNGSFGYQGINARFPPLPEAAPAGTQSASIKFTVTGHGGDQTSCCEFTSHNYQVSLDGVTTDTKAIWRDNCGMNELYPQSGTWIFQRGNWCPGAQVYPNFHVLPGISAGTTFFTDIQFDPYTGGGSYTTEAHLIYYGGMNKTLDASMEHIVAPTNDENYFRENPISGNPIVHVRNSGATSIDSISFQYGVADSPLQYFTWVGTLDPLQETDVVLPSGSYQLNNLAGTSGLHNFTATIIRVNGVSDDDGTNNSMTSQFVSAPLWPSTFKIWFRTNNETITGSSTICETSWYIYDMYGNIFAQRSNATINTTYFDTISCPAGGYYNLVVYDSSCDGLNWWANAGTGISSGYLQVKQLSGTNILMNGYSYGGTYNNDFGCGFSQYFSTGPLVQTGIRNISENEVALEAYPNPASSVVNVDISGMQYVNGTLQVIDALGRIVSVTQCNTAHRQINVEGLASGVYTVLFVDALQQNKKLTARLLIVK